MFTKLNRLRNVLNGDLELPQHEADQLSFGFEHFIMQSTERTGTHFDPQVIEARLLSIQNFMNIADKVPAGRTIKFKNRHNGVTVRAIKNNDQTFEIV